MKLHYDRETDSLYIELLDRPSVDSEEVLDGIVLDFDEKRKLVGIDVQHASKNVEMTHLEADFAAMASAGER